MTKTENFTRVEVASEEELWDWLAAHHAQEASVWLVTWKKPSPKYLSTGQVLDALVAHGWIDGIRRKHEDADLTMQLIAPRKMQAWAQSYKDRALKLREEGRMQMAGEAEIEASLQNGMWDFYADVDALIQPEDLNDALDQHPPARAYFEESSRSYRRNVLRWIKLAKTEATRAKRIAAAATASQKQERLPQM
ncbi:MAG: YdeI/OmpD-associated family protein [Pseudomonadota bacterium]